MKIIVKRPVEGISVPELGQPVATSPSTIVVPMTRPSTGSVALTRYEVERSLTGTGGWAQVASGPLIFGNPATQYADGGLTPVTTYFYRARAVAGAFTSAFCAVVSNTTLSTITSLWAPNTPSLLPVMPGVAGWGSDCRGGTGRDAISGGLAAPFKVYWCYTPAQQLAAMLTTGRRAIYKVRSGLWDWGSDAAIETQGGTMEVVDLSPGQGAVDRGLQFSFAFQPDIWTCNLHLLANNATGGVTAENSNCMGVEESPTFTALRHFHQNNLIAFTADTIMTYYWRCQGLGTFQNVFMNPVHFNSLHPEAPGGLHGFGPQIGWTDRLRQVSSLRDIYFNCALRTPLSGATQFQAADGAVCNWQQRATQIAQHSDGFPSGFPTQSNIEHMLYIRGMNHTFNPPIGLGESPLHTGSLVYISGCRGIGITDAAQTDLYINQPGSLHTISPTRLSAAAPPGYTTNPIANTAVARVARAQLLVDSCGPRPLQRLAYLQQEVNKFMASANQAPTGQGVGLLTRGQEVYPSNTPADANFLTGPFIFPGVSSMAAGGIDVGTAGRTILTSGPYAGYSAWDATKFQILNSMGVHA